MPAPPHAQNRAIEFTLLLSIPCLAAFFVIPELIMRALFMRGAFTAADAVAAGRTLAAYAVGLLPFVLIRSTVATFFARGDTATPVKAALIAAAVNIAFKFLLMGPLAQVGLALATSIGAWINLGLVVWFARRAGHVQHRRALAAIGAQACAAPGWRWRPCLWLCAGAGRASVRRLARLHDVATLAVLAAIGGRRLWWHRIGAVRAAAGSRHFAPRRARLTRSSRFRGRCRSGTVDIAARRRYGDGPGYSSVGRYHRYS